MATVLPAELDLVKVLASGRPITGLTMDMVDQMNAQHAQAHANCSRLETLNLVQFGAFHPPVV